MKKFYVVLEIVMTGCKLLKMSLILAHIKQTCERHKFTPFSLPYSYTLLQATIVAQFDVAKQLVNDVTLILAAFMKLQVLPLDLANSITIIELPT